MIRSVLQYFDIRFYIKFALLFLAMYGTYMFVISAAAPTGTYFPIIDHYFNFPVIIRTCVLHGARLILSLFGIESYITSDSLVNGDVTKVVRMAWPCYGLMLKSFWLAYVIAHSHPVKKKIFWSLAGILTIFFINCSRVALLYISMVGSWSIGEQLNTNNHDLFNYVSYVFIILLIFLHNRKSNSVLHPDDQTFSPQTGALTA